VSQLLKYLFVQYSRVLRQLSCKILQPNDNTVIFNISLYIWAFVRFSRNNANRLLFNIVLVTWSPWNSNVYRSLDKSRHKTNIPFHGGTSHALNTKCNIYRDLECLRLTSRLSYLLSGITRWGFSQGPTASARKASNVQSSSPYVRTTKLGQPFRIFPLQTLWPATIIESHKTHFKILRRYARFQP